jgi:hypothetical protein
MIFSCHLGLPACRNKIGTFMTRLELNLSTTL